MSSARGQAQAPAPAPASWNQPADYFDPGSIAVTRGLARRDTDGSVTFDPTGASAAELADTPPHSASGEQAGQPGQPPVAAPAPAPAAAPPGAPGAHAASGAATPPLDELVRQLFGPLSARLKAELRLDRERAGLLTDLR